MGTAEIPCTLASGDSVTFEIDNTEDDDEQIDVTWYDVYAAIAGK